MSAGDDSKRRAKNSYRRRRRRSSRDQTPRKPKRCVVCAERALARCCLLISHEARTVQPGVCAAFDIGSRSRKSGQCDCVWFFLARKNFGLPERQDFALAGDLAEQAYPLM